MMDNLIKKLGIVILFLIFALFSSNSAYAPSCSIGSCTYCSSNCASYGNDNDCDCTSSGGQCSIADGSACDCNMECSSGICSNGVCGTVTTTTTTTTYTCTSTGCTQCLNPGSGNCWSCYSTEPVCLSGETDCGCPTPVTCTYAGQTYSVGSTKSCGSGNCAGTNTCQSDGTWSSCSTSGNTCTISCNDYCFTDEWGEFFVDYSSSSALGTCSSTGYCSASCGTPTVTTCDYGCSSTGCYECSYWSSPDGCASSQYCSSGSCASCPSGKANCDQTQGCETDITTTSNCGSCGNVCNPGQTCTNGACITPCDYSPSCDQTTLDTSNTNCGATRPSTTACDGGCETTAWSGGTDCTLNAVNKVCSSSGTCVQCTSNSHCTDASKPVCDTSTNTCVRCVSDSDCGAGNYCTSSKTCATKTCSTHGSNNVCDSDISNSNRCTEGQSADCVDECYDNPNWPYGLSYDSSSKKCVQCVSDSDCPDICGSDGLTTDLYCNNNKCSWARNKCPAQGPITPECEGFYCDDRTDLLNPFSPTGFNTRCCTTNFGGPGSMAGKCLDQDGYAYTGHPKIDYSGNLVGDGYLCVKASPETVSGNQYLRVVKTGALTNDFMKISTQDQRIGYQILASFYDANGDFAAQNSAVWIGIAKYGCTDYSQGSSCWVPCVACAGAENFNKYTLNQQGTTGPICACDQWDNNECKRMTCETQWQTGTGEKGFTADSSWQDYPFVNIATYAYDGKDGFGSGWQTGSKITVSDAGCTYDEECYQQFDPHSLIVMLRINVLIV